MLTRADSSVFGRWWLTVDRWTLLAVALLMVIGAVLIQAASPAIAVAHKLDSFYFVKRHLVMLAPAIVFLLGASMLSPRGVRIVAFLLFLLALSFSALTPLIGMEIKGAMRWINLAGFSMQPSEFLKPSFAVLTALFLARRAKDITFPGYSVAAFLLCLTIFILMRQPDFGMSFLIAIIFGAEITLAGLPILLIGVLAVLGFFGIIAAYFLFPHVASRIDRFLDSSSGDTYQVQNAMEAFMNGGLLGTGPGSGTVKLRIPDAHADFIFAVAGEELGTIACLLIVAVYGFIVLRGFARVRQDTSLFTMLAAGGLLTAFGVQAFVNMGSTTHLLPAKGMTLPFISYGGSSLWANAILMGMVLALTRKRYGTPGDTL
jgi:cell division protein FtsW